MATRKARPAKPREPGSKIALEREREDGVDVPPERLARADADAFIPDPEKTHRRVPDDLAELFGENFVQAATTGNDVDPEEQPALFPEEAGGPFIETDAETEFGDTLVQDSQVEDAPALSEPFPTAVRAGTGPSSGLVEEIREPDEVEEEGQEKDEEDEEDEETLLAPPAVRRPRALTPKP